MSSPSYPQIWNGPETEIQLSPDPPPRWKRWRGSAWRASRQGAQWAGRTLAIWWRNGSTNTRIVLSIAAVLALAMGVRGAIQAIWPAPSYVRVVCAHPFRVAQIIAWIDDKEAANDVMIANSAPTEMSEPYRRAVILRRAESMWTQTLPIARGPHSLRVRVASTEEPFDRTRTLDLEITPGQTTTIEIACNRGHMVAFAAPPYEPRAMALNPLQNPWFAHYGSPATLGLAALAIATAVVLLMRGRAPQLALRRAA